MHNSSGLLFHLLILLVPPPAAQAAVIDHGVYGTLFPVAEQDLREVFKSRLKHLTDTGRMQQLETEFRAKAESAAIRPAPITNLNPTVTPRTFTHDPTLVIDNTIVDHLGNILANQGDRINPLDHISLQKGLLFIDGDNPAHTAWATTHQDRFHIILVNGAPLDLSNTIGTAVYFDQGGYLTTHYGIKQTPAKIEQLDKLLQISEFKIEDEETP